MQHLVWHEPRAIKSNLLIVLTIKFLYCALFIWRSEQNKHFAAFRKRCCCCPVDEYEMFIYFDLMRRLQSWKRQSLRLTPIFSRTCHASRRTQTHKHTYIHMKRSQLGDAAVSVFVSVINFPATRRMHNEGKLWATVRREGRGRPAWLICLC